MLERNLHNFVGGEEPGMVMSYGYHLVADLEMELFPLVCLIVSHALWVAVVLEPAVGDVFDESLLKDNLIKSVANPRPETQVRVHLHTHSMTTVGMCFNTSTCLVTSRLTHWTLKKTTMYLCLDRNEKATPKNRYVWLQVTCTCLFGAVAVS